MTDLVALTDLAALTDFAAFDESLVRRLPPACVRPVVETLRLGQRREKTPSVEQLV